MSCFKQSYVSLLEIFETHKVMEGWALTDQNMVQFRVQQRACMCICE